MFGLGTSEIICILAVFVLLFGASKLPELAKSIGKSAGEFKKAQKEAEISFKKFEESLNSDTIVSTENIQENNIEEKNK